MDKYAIFLDFDSTLSQHNTISEENCRVLRKVQELGHYIFINTGRNYQGIAPVASKYHSFSGYVSGLGSYITLGDEVLYEKFFDFETVETAVRKLLGKEYVAIATTVDRGYIMNPKKEQLEFFTQIPSLEFLRENCRNDKFQKIESENTVWTEEEVEFWHSLGTTFFHQGYTECCPVGCSKSKAIEIVAKKLGIKMENTIAMGDSANDIDMLAAAGIGVVMGNAPDFMKENADFVTKSCTEHGVAHALCELILNKKA